MGLYDIQEKSGSPGDILTHYGKKGMRWGVRNEDDASSDLTAARRNEVEKQKMAKGLTTDKSKLLASRSLRKRRKEALW